MRVLLVDDDSELVEATAYALRRQRFDVITATDSETGLGLWRSKQPDAIVLDVNMSPASGFEFCRTVRASSTTPVILLTARDDEESLVQGFQAGADDYLTKPFSVRELGLRITAMSRRLAPAATRSPGGELQVGQIVFDPRHHQARSGDTPVALTRVEHRLLLSLMTHPDEVLSMSALTEDVWGFREDDSDLLRTHVSRLRSKLRLPKAGPGSIVAVRGVGYKLVNS
jgi:DNA-binding response OmpR family regulator